MSFVAAAMERNKFIYAQAAATAVVRADLKKGGTYSGASEALKHNWGLVFVWDNKLYPGNQDLIRLGGKALDNSGSSVQQDKSSYADVKKDEDNNEYVQMSLFDNLNNN